MMIRSTLFVLFLASSFFAVAQTVAMATDANTTITAATEIADRMVPAFPTSSGSFADFIKGHLTYPEIARDYAVEGTVVIEVEVAANGKVTFSKVAKPLFSPLDQAAVALIDELPRFLPAAANGAYVARTMMIPFKFSLR